MSGFLRALLGDSSQAGPEQSTAIAGVLQQVLAQNGGGIAALISRFTDAGLGDNAQSWVSGNRRPITPDHIDQVFTQDEIASWASQAGTDPDKMRAVLAEVLPHAVDHTTPNGEIPAPNVTPDLSSLVRRFMGGIVAFLIVLTIPTLTRADEAVAGNWKAQLGSNVSITMDVSSDGKWSSQTAKGDSVVAQMSGTYDQKSNSPTSGNLVFTPINSQTAAQHGAPDVEHDRYQLTDHGQVMRLTSGKDTMVFRKQ